MRWKNYYSLMQLPCSELRTFEITYFYIFFSAFRDWFRRIGMKSHIWLISFLALLLLCRSHLGQSRSVLHSVTTNALVLYGMNLHSCNVFDIYVNCNWVDTLWQQYSTQLHTNSTQNSTMKQNTQNGTYITIIIHKYNYNNT